MVKILVVAALLVATNAHAATFVDWTSIDTSGDIALGTACNVNVSLTGFDISTGSTTGTFQGFNNAYFCPPLANSDFVEFRGTSPANSYVLTFSPPVTNPTLHILSLASTLTFSGVTLTALCGQNGFTVEGNTVTGLCLDGQTPNDANGTVQINGTVSSVTFTAFFAGCLGFTIDGINIQVGIACPTAVGQHAPGMAALGQNVPNPFNPETVIPFVLPAGGAMTEISIYDLNGGYVCTLVRGFVEGGAHSATWDGRAHDGTAVGSGVYFCRLVAGATSETRKMVLLK